MDFGRTDHMPGASTDTRATDGTRQTLLARWLREHLGENCLDTVVVHAGPRSYCRSAAIAVEPVALLERDEPPL